VVEWIREEALLGDNKSGIRLDLVELAFPRQKLKRRNYPRPPLALDIETENRKK